MTQRVLPTNVPGFGSVRQAPPSREDRFALGRSLREKVPYDLLGEWTATPARFDPIALIAMSHVGRVADLVGIRVARMATTPYGFYRGSAVVMAADVASLPSTGIHPVICGDAHLGNFGFYRSPEGAQVIDLNDFDEAHPGAWEWDLRRLVASVWVAGRENGYSEDACAASAHSCVVEYAAEVDKLATLPLLARSYNRLDVSHLKDSVQERTLREEIKRAAKTARRRTSDRVLPKLTEEVDGHRRIIPEPPITTAVESEDASAVGAGLDDYLTTLAPHWRRVVAGYTVEDVAHRVVGVGSVGLRAYVVLLVGSSPDDVLFLQLKQARRSVLARFVHGEEAWHAHQGQRVVEYQQALQTVSDPLLGWTTIEGREYYVRQFRNMKGTVPLNAIREDALSDYAGIVGRLLAKGHARTSGASMISGYLGDGDAAGVALARFARLYADQTEADWATLVTAAKAGKLPMADDAYMASAFRPG
ncbi:MAG: DUF2252 domain-containing protein [Propionicimonas sp.]|uniref:DUF2252 domain-containing protein n=1 Tax=Propionicimonas sp. TaxID=1955623 RepID=UPI003D0F7A4F